jgi:hypothetical protein
MCKVILVNLLTLDGFFEGSKSGDLAFYQTGWGPELEAFVNEQDKSVGTLWFG